MKQAVEKIYGLLVALKQRNRLMNGIIYIVGLVVVIGVIFSFFGLR